jgi:hypothetical protein
MKILRRPTLALASAVAAVAFGWSALGRTASPSPQGMVMHVESIAVNFANVGGPNRLPSAYVTIRDEFGFPVNGATVTGNWNGCFNKTASGVTQTWFNSSGAITADGMAKVTGKKHSCWGANSCNFVFTVTNVTKSGMPYDPSANVATSRDIPCF